MSDPIGSLGRTAVAQSDSDLNLVYQGGSGFMARMDALTNAREQYDRAFIALKIGNDAKNAYDDAKQKQAEATSALANANRVLEKARADAAELVKLAKDGAASIVASAQSEADKISTGAEVKRRDAETYAKTTQWTADKRLKEIDATKAEVSVALQAAKDAAVRHAAAEAEAAQSHAAAQARHEALIAKTKKLHAVLTEITMPFVETSGFTFVPFNVQPTNSTWTDDTVSAISTADVGSIREPVSLNAFTGLGTATIAFATGLGIPLAPGTSTIWGVVLANATLSNQFSTTAGVSVTIKMLQDC